MAVTDLHLSRIIDNSEDQRTLRAVLEAVLDAAVGLDVCVGYFHLRGWDILADWAENFEGGEPNQARVLVGMHVDPVDEMKADAGLTPPHEFPDAPERAKIKTETLERFRQQLTWGLPTNSYEHNLRRLADQLRRKKVSIRLYTRSKLHAKLYLARRNDAIFKRFGVVGSSNLTGPGLWRQGELNVSVWDQPECAELQEWFDKRWEDPLSIDITDLLEGLISKGWARDDVRPYLIYLRMAYHIAVDGIEARKEFPIPKPFDDLLYDFQKEAVQLAAHKLLSESGFGGVMLADVVGLGKTFMASAVIKTIQNDRGERTAIICPKNLVPMWKHFINEYQLWANVFSLSQLKELDRGRYGVFVIDESHNLRNREGKRYRFISQVIDENKESKVMLLTATPMNKHYLDVGSQLRLMVPPDSDLGVSPNQLIKKLNEKGEPIPQHPTSLSAFEQSEEREDWRELLRLFMVRRTRGYLVDRGFTDYDEAKDRHYLTDRDGAKHYFPLRQPEKLEFSCNDNDPNDQYARLYTQSIADTILHLHLARYGLGEYVDKTKVKESDKKATDDLGKARRRLIGYCKMNLFKRLESSGHAFMISLERHILRNLIFVHAIENNLPLPIGTQEVDLLDPAESDADSSGQLEIDDGNEEGLEGIETAKYESLEAFKAKAVAAYDRYRAHGEKLFTWLPPAYFKPTLKKDLLTDAEALLEIMRDAGEWRPQADENLKSLHKLISETHKSEKVLVFTQFADTANYLYTQLAAMGVKDIDVATGSSPNPTDLAIRFSPRSNDSQINDQLRVLISTDVLSEGQNLQDAHIVVNYDLPWAIIRLVQRAGRVDRIGQENLTILCYSVWPRDGLDNIIKLRTRLVERLQASGEVLGTDERFLNEVVGMDENLRRLYAGERTVLEDKDKEVDLASEAMKIWDAASKEDQDAALKLLHNSYATRKQDEGDDGALVFARYGDSQIFVNRVDAEGKVISNSISEILDAAKCEPDTPSHKRHDSHHDLVKSGIAAIAKERFSPIGRLGSPRETRRRLYERLRGYANTSRDLFTDDLQMAVEAIYRAPLTETAKDSFGRMLRSEMHPADLAEQAIRWYQDAKLTIDVVEEEQPQDPELVCSMGLWHGEETD